MVLCLACFVPCAKQLWLAFLRRRSAKPSEAKPSHKHNHSHSMTSDTSSPEVRGIGLDYPLEDTKLHDVGTASVITLTGSQRPKEISYRRV